MPADPTPPPVPALPRDVWDAAEQAQMDADAYTVDPREAMASVAYAAGVAAGEARGRTAAAADLRAWQRQTRKGSVVDDVLDIAARIAEGDDRG